MVLESMGPRLNSSEQISWNLCFKLGRNGESIQCWAFGSETEIKLLSEKITIDSYIVFWGDYSVSPKTSSNLLPTSDWIVKIPPKSKCIGKVHLIISKSSPEPEDPDTVQAKETFSTKFEQPRKMTKKR